MVSMKKKGTVFDEGETITRGYFFLFFLFEPVGGFIFRNNFVLSSF